MFKKQTHAGININDRSIEIVVIDSAEHPKRIQAIGRTTLPQGAIERGVIRQKEKVLRALKAVRAQAGFKENAKIRVTLSVSEELIFPFSVAFEAPQSEEKEQSAIIEYAHSHVPLPENDIALYALDRHVSETTIFVYAFSRTILAQYEQTLNDAWIDVEHIEPESVAMARCMLPELHTQQTATVIDIGTSITHIVTLHEGYPLLSQSIPLGAESVKKTLATKRNSSFSPSKISKTVKGFIDELKSKISLADEFSKRYRNDSENHEIIVVGGGALLPHMIDSLSSALERTVRVGSIGQLLDMDRKIKSDLPMFVQAIGSSLRESSNVANTALSPIEKKGEKPASHISLSVFKSRTTLLIVLFALLVILLVALILYRQKTDQGMPEEIRQQQDTQSAATVPQKSIQVFSVDVSPTETLLPFTIQTQRVTKTTEIETTGSVTKPGTAQGAIMLHNDSSSAKPLVAQTRLVASNGEIFRIQTDVVIPANGTLEVTAVADNENATEHIPANSRFSIPGLSQFNQQIVYGINTETISVSGGTVSAVSEEDKTTAQSLLEETALQELADLFDQNSPEGSIVSFVSSLTEFSATITPQVGTEAENAQVSLTADGTALEFTDTDIHALAESRGISAETIQSIDATISAFDPATQSGTVILTIQIGS